MTPVALMAIAFGVQYVVQRGRASRYAYTCESCGNVFSLPPLTASLAPHRMGQKWVRCPRCGVRSWATPVLRV